jgi:signal transduction histidine kinase
MPPADAPERPRRSLTRLLLRLTAIFAVLALVAILLPALGRACHDWLEARVNAAHLAALALEAAGGDMLDPALQDEVLTLAGVELVSLRTPGRRLLPLARDDRPIQVGTTIDLRRLTLPRATLLSLRLLADRDGLPVRVIGVSAADPDTVVDLVMPRAPLAHALGEAAARIVATGLVIAVAGAALLFLALRLLLVRPIRELTDSIRRFEAEPEAPQPPPLSRRDDEIGAAMAAVAAMQERIREDLWRKSRLAALGTAMAKVNHDLRGVLATALLLSDRLSSSTDPKVRAAAPMLLGAIERAIALAARTMEFAREGPPTLATTVFPLAPLVSEAAEAARAAADRADASVAVDAPPGLALTADRDLLFRVFLNLLRNAIEAGARMIRVSAAAEAGVVAIELADDGPGLPPALAADPFRPFHSGRRGGSGLGLAIARDLVRAHGGDIELAETGPAGTRFRLSLPQGLELDGEPGQAPAKAS